MNKFNHLFSFHISKLSICFTALAFFCFSTAQAVLWVHDFIKLEDALNSQLDFVDKNHPTSHILDQITLKILKTKTGKAFCRSVNEKQLTHEFFINTKYIPEGLKICKDYFKPESQNKIQNYKAYFLVVGKTKNLERLDGWTSFQNHTYLFFSSKDEITEERLTRTLAHEMAIAYDAKDMIGFGGAVELTLGVPIIRDENSCPLTQLLSRSDLRHALKSIRAFEIEKRIAEELNITLPKGFADWSKQSCGQKIHFMLSQMQSLKDIIDLNYNRTYNLYDHPDCRTQAVQDLTQEESVANFEKINISFRDGSSMKACDYFTAGWPYASGRSFNGGPGPRIGGGAWGSLKESP